MTRSESIASRTFRTNAFFIEGPDGVVLIDTMFTPSEGVRTVDHAERMTGKKVVLAIVLHANPDKFNGTQALQERGIRVLTSEQVRALIPEVFALRTKWFADRYRPDWPTEVPLPDAFGSTTKTVEAAGLELTVHVLGPAVSEAHVAVEWNGHLFVGDLVANEHHGWLELGLMEQWLDRLAELEALQPRHVHPGRGVTVREPAAGTAGEHPIAPSSKRMIARCVQIEHPDIDPLPPTPRP